MQQNRLTSSLVARRNPGSRPKVCYLATQDLINSLKEALIKSDPGNPVKFYSEVSITRHLLDCAVRGAWRGPVGFFSNYW